ncbi:MAG TPA: multicopper oxidase domain-containing protein, partial [Candidatus Nitrosocosmicus sp.]|nr:multicopper oxidase domain-containing protein [Candidatus Nitrosocosmicus sp.]
MVLKGSFTGPVIVVISIITIIVVGLSGHTFLPLNTGISSQAKDSNSENKLIGTHTPGYPIIRTSGDILDPITIPGDSKNAVIDPMKYLRNFNYGHTTVLPNGTTLREFTLIASDREIKEVSPGVFYNVWTFNGTIPGPTIRATEGDKIRINLINNGSKPHSLHTHGIHPAEMDGVFDMIGPKGKFTYEFTAEPYGVYPYHCHMTPLEEHITHGLYGVMIIDPKTPRPPADEMVMVMNGYDTDFDTENNFYTVNGIPYYYMHNPIQIQKNEPIRVYLVNMLEFDPINNFHLHANMFNYFPSGTSKTPVELNDIVTMSQGERGILEFKYKYPGNYMFHAHKTEFAEKGWMGIFQVVDKLSNQDSKQKNANKIADFMKASFSKKSQDTTAIIQGKNQSNSNYQNNSHIYDY